MARKKKASLGILFWIAFILFILVIFLFNRSNIENVLENTGLVTVLKDRISGDEEVTVERDDGSQETEVEDRRAPSESGDRVVVELDEDEPAGSSGGVNETPAEENDDGSDDESGPSSAEEDSVGNEEDDEASDPVTVAEKPQKVRDAKIYFIRPTEDGRINLQPVVRSVNFANSPMTDTIQTLIQGPTTEELDMGLLNLIPENTRLLSATVDENGTAVLNFNEAFRFNPLGVEGYIAQLKQIVYSTTEFSTVGRVQILIEGEQVDYLSPEGIFVREPLARESFS